MRFSIYLIGIVIVWITQGISYNDCVVFKFTNAVCETYNKSWIIIPQCRLYAVNRNRNTFNLNATLLHPVYNASLNMQILKKANGYKPWIIKASIDVCRFLKTTYNPAAKIIYDLFKDFSNLNHTCPFVGTQLIQGFYLRPETLRLPFPSGEYLLTMLWSFEKRPQFATNLYFVFTEDLDKL